MRNFAILLIAVSVGWWFAARPTTEAVARADGTLSYPGYEIRTVERFELEARVLSRHDYGSGREAELSPTDLALGWGPMAEDRVLEAIDIRQSNRWYTWRADRLPLAKSEITAHSANVHLIPASAAAADSLADVRRDDRVRLVGQLVDVDAHDGWRWRTSRSRTDTGNGACELLWLERIEWL